MQFYLKFWHGFVVSHKKRESETDRGPERLIIIRDSVSGTINKEGS